MPVSDRRSLIRTVVLATFGAALGKLDVWAAQRTMQEGTGGIERRGTVRIPLDQWKYLTFEFGGKQIALPTEEIFKALEEAYGSASIPAHVQPRRGK